MEGFDVTGTALPALQRVLAGENCYYFTDMAMDAYAVLLEGPTIRSGIEELATAGYLSVTPLGSDDQIQRSTYLVTAVRAPELMPTGNLKIGSARQVFSLLKSRLRESIESHQ